MSCIGNSIKLVQNKGATRITRMARSLTREQFHGLLRGLHESIGSLALLSVCLGPNISEALTLQWSDVDWLQTRISIQREIVEEVVVNVKTEDFARVLNLIVDMLERLKAQKQASNSPAPGDWIFACPAKPGWQLYATRVYGVS